MLNCRWTANSTARARAVAATREGSKGTIRTSITLGIATSPIRPPLERERSAMKLVGLFGDRVQPDPSKWMLYDLQNDPGEETRTWRSNIRTRWPNCGQSSFAGSTK